LKVILTVSGLVFVSRAFAAEIGVNADKSDIVIKGYDPVEFYAFGVSKEKKFDTDPTAWKIIEDKLYLNLNSQVQQRWLKDSENLIKDAKEYWREIAFVPASDL